MDEVSCARKKCAAIKTDGSSACSKNALPDRDYCWMHSRIVAPSGELDQKSLPFPSGLSGGLAARAAEIRGMGDIMSMEAEVSILKALLERGLKKLDDEISSADPDDSSSEASAKRVQSLAMDILSAAEKCARVEERRRGVLTAAEIGTIIDRIKERVIHVVRTSKENDPPEQTARRIAEAFSSIEIVGCG